MKSTVRIVALALVVVMAAGLLASCASMKILGTWKYSIGTTNIITVEFKAGGKGLVKTATGKWESFTWKIKGKELTYTVYGVTNTTGFSIKGNALTLDSFLGVSGIFLKSK